MATILLIDDDDEVRETLRELLEARGYDVAAAPNGRVGLEILSERGADVVITDIFMPEMEGIETIMQLRATRPGVPIIAMSGGGPWNTVQFLTTAQHLGAVETLAKPIGFDELISAVRTALKDRSSARAS